MWKESLLNCYVKYIEIFDFPPPQLILYTERKDVIRMHLQRWQGSTWAYQESHEIAPSVDLAQREENDYWRLEEEPIVDEDIEVDSGNLKELTGVLDEEQRYECRWEDVSWCPGMPKSTRYKCKQLPDTLSRARRPGGTGDGLLVLLWCQMEHQG